MEKVVTVIPASKQRYTQAPIGEIRKRRACGYARVSTDNEEQKTSYESQLRYYEQYIKSRDDLEFVGMYSDEGITATSMKHRTGFNQMVADALDGKIDLIITKSVSRFARNTVDSLTTVRRLKEHGVEIYFEKENIWTLDSKGELLITIMSSLAQEESRSISENTTWGQRKRMADGHGCLAFSSFLGYDKGLNGEFVINEEQAKVVKRIFTDYMDGSNTAEIARNLTRDGVKTPMGKDKWHTSTVLSILKNEKYMGACLMQKTYTDNFLTKKQIKNNGELKQYYVEDHHPAIVTKELFDAVQVKMARNSYKKHTSAARDFSSLIICGDCGSFYGSKVMHSNKPYRKIVYYCNSKYKGEKCETPTIPEEKIKELFVEAINKVLVNKDEVIENLMQISNICNEDDYYAVIRKAAVELDEAEKEYQEILDNQKISPDEFEIYEAKIQEAITTYNEAKDRYTSLMDRSRTSSMHMYEIERIIDTLRSQDGIVREYDFDLMKLTVDIIKVYRDMRVVFVFAGGVEIELSI